MDTSVKKIPSKYVNPTTAHSSPYNLIRDPRIFLDIPKYNLINNLPRIPTDYKYNDLLKDKLQLIKDLTLLKIMFSDAVKSKKCLDGGLNEEGNRLKFIQCSLICKMIILSSSSLSLPSTIENTDIQEYQLLYMLWEVHLSSLLMSNDLQCLSIARHECLKLSREFYKLTNVLTRSSPSNDKDINSSGNSNSNGFPNNCPLNLQLLIIRIRTNGPNLTAANELYQLLYKLRSMGSLNQDDSFIISLSISTNLIGKNNYLTFLTLADNMITSYEQEDNDFPRNLDFKNDYLLLSCLVYLMLQKSELAQFQFNQLELSKHDDGNGNNSVEPLKKLTQILTSITPILDNENLLNLKPLNDSEISFKLDKDDRSQSETNFEVLKKLHANGRITGRILCCYCGLLEVDLKSKKNDVDETLIQDEDGVVKVHDDISNELKIFKSLLIQGWFKNIKGVYGFE